MAALHEQNALNLEHRPKVYVDYNESHLCEIMNSQIEQIDPEIVEFEKSYFGDGKRSVHYLSLASVRKVMDLAHKFKFVPADDERSKFTFKLALDEIAPSTSTSE